MKLDTHGVTQLVPVEWIKRTDMTATRKLDGILVRQDPKTGKFFIPGRNEGNPGRTNTAPKQSYLQSVYAEFQSYRMARGKRSRKIPVPVEILFTKGLTDGEKLGLLILYTFRRPAPDGKGFVDSGWIAPPVFRREVYGPNWKGNNYLDLAAGLVVAGVISLRRTEVGQRRWDFALLDGWKNLLRDATGKDHKGALVFCNGATTLLQRSHSVSATEPRASATEPQEEELKKEKEAKPPTPEDVEDHKSQKTPPHWGGGLRRLRCIQCSKTFSTPTPHHCEQAPRAARGAGRLTPPSAGEEKGSRCQGAQNRDERIRRVRTAYLLRKTESGISLDGGAA